MSTPSPEDRETDRDASVPAAPARPQRSSGVLVHWADPPPALAWIGVAALVVIVMLQIAILAALVFAPPYVLVRGG